LDARVIASRKVKALFLSAALVLALWPARAFGESSDHDRAQALYDEGARAYARGDPGLALERLRQSYEIFPSLRTLYSIGLCQFELRDYPASYTSLTQYLEEGGDQVPDALEARAEALIVRMRPTLAFVTVSVNVTGAAISLDGDLRSSRRPARISRRAGGAHGTPTSGATGDRRC
jgi:hypothetical protein